MGWFWPDPQPSTTSTDPFHRLDPQVRDFLLRESPLKPASSTTASSSTPTPSKYGDRYADIWAQYTPPTQQDSAKPASEQLTDIIKAYKWRKGAIGRAALENCAETQWALHECYRRGGVAAKLTACSAENKRLNECYTSQANFLRALGYMSDFNRDPAVDERIQMHADRLYQEQVRQDELAAAARKGESLTSDPSSSSSSEEKTL